MITATHTTQHRTLLILIEPLPKVTHMRHVVTLLTRNKEPLNGQVADTTPYPPVVIVLSLLRLLDHLQITIIHLVATIPNALHWCLLNSFHCQSHIHIIPTNMKLNGWMNCLHINKLEDLHLPNKMARTVQHLTQQ